MLFAPSGLIAHRGHKRARSIRLFAKFNRCGLSRFNCYGKLLSLVYLCALLFPCGAILLAKFSMPVWNPLNVRRSMTDDSIIPMFSSALNYSRTVEIFSL